LLLQVDDTMRTDSTRRRWALEGDIDDEPLVLPVAVLPLVAVPLVPELPVDEVDPLELPLSSDPRISTS
jgi:hypothetical protein